MQAAIGKLDGHYILCGYGRVGRQVARVRPRRRALRRGRPGAGIIEECLVEGYLALLGEASDDTVLEEAGVRRARGWWQP